MCSSRLEVAVHRSALGHTTLVACWCFFHGLVLTYLTRLCLWKISVQLQSTASKMQFADIDAFQDLLGLCDLGEIHNLKWGTCIMLMVKQCFIPLPPEVSAASTTAMHR